MSWFGDNIVTLTSVLLGSGGVVYAVVTHALTRKKYRAETAGVQAQAATAEDAFWRARYDVLQEELKTKDEWWRGRYDSLYEQFEHERALSNDMVASFRAELTQMREEYERARQTERDKYTALLAQYRELESESAAREKEYKARIRALEDMIAVYEDKIQGFNVTK